MLIPRGFIPEVGAREQPVRKGAILGALVQLKELDVFSAILGRQLARSDEHLV